MKDFYTQEYINWLKKNYPDSDYTKDAIIDFEAQESRKRFNKLWRRVSSRSEHTVIARGSEDSYDDWNNNQNWSDFSRTIRG